MRRAGGVKVELVHGGVAICVIHSHGYGEMHSLAATGLNIPELQTSAWKSYCADIAVFAVM